MIAYTRRTAPHVMFLEDVSSAAVTVQALNSHVTSHRRRELTDGEARENDGDCGRGHGVVTEESSRERGKQARNERNQDTSGHPSTISIAYIETVGFTYS